MLPALVIVAVVLFVGSLALMKGGMARTRTRSARAALEARQALGRGESTDSVARSLATAAKLPSLAAVRAMADAAGMKPADAVAALRPHLTEHQLDVIDRMPTQRFNKAMRDLSSS
jgi:hypothetical protein